MNVVNVAVTLGSRVDRQVERWQELKNCCDYIGFGLVVPAERGLEGINPAGRDKDPQRWASSVKTIAELLTEHRPSIVFFPHDDDWMLRSTRTAEPFANGSASNGRGG